MDINPSKIDLEKIRLDQKSEGRNMKSDLEAIKSNYDREKKVESANKNETASEPTPPPENLNQTGTSSLASPTKLLSDAWQLYKSRWKTFLGIAVVPILFMFFVGIILGTGIIITGELVQLPPSIANLNMYAFIIALISFLVLFISLIIIQFWSQTALIFAIKDSEENIGVKESYRRGWHKIRQFFWVSILSSLIIMGGYIFFIIPGIIFYIWFNFAVYIVVSEDLKGMDAILKSREYVRNYWWNVLWRFLFVFIIIFFIVFIPGFFLKILNGIIPASGGDLVAIIMNLLMNIIYLIIAPLLVIYLFLIYSNLKKIKGNFEFKPSAKAKKSFIAAGVLGILAVAVVIAGMAFAFLTIFSSLDNTMNKTINEKPPLDSSRRGDLEIIFEENIEEKIKMRDKWRISDLNTISTILQFYKTKNEIYPVSKMTVRLKNNYITDELESISSENIPLDPKDPEYYYGYKSLDGESFELTARLENESNSLCDENIKNMCIYKIVKGL